jgi:hypothetical protein
MTLKEAVLMARQAGEPALIVKSGDGYDVQELEDDVQLIYLGGDELPVAVGPEGRQGLQDMLFSFFAGKASKVAGAKIKRRFS